MEFLKDEEAHEDGGWLDGCVYGLVVGDGLELNWLMPGIRCIALALYGMAMRTL